MKKLLNNKPVIDKATLILEKYSEQINKDERFYLKHVLKKGELQSLHHTEVNFVNGVGRRLGL